MSFCERQQILIKFPKNQVKFRPRLEPEKERALASFHVMNSVKVVMVPMMMMLMLMLMIVMVMMMMMMVVVMMGMMRMVPMMMMMMLMLMMVMVIGYICSPYKVYLVFNHPFWASPNKAAPIPFNRSTRVFGV